MIATTAVPKELTNSEISTVVIRHFYPGYTKQKGSSLTINF